MLLTFALFHPRIVAVREQFVLQLEASDHPLQGHPEYIGHAFDPLPGILNVYLEMGVIKNYPKTPHPKTSEWVPLVLLNDCLLFVRDDLGIHVCNISVKRTAAQFQQHSLETPLEMQSTAQNEKALIRHQAEEEYFARAGIPTRRFTFSTFDQVFANNLDWLVKSSLLLDPKLSYLLDYLVPNLNSIIGLQVRCSEVAERFCREFDISPINWACLMARAIVSGQVKIDLHKKVLPDGFLYPSKPEDEARYDCLISREGF